MRWVSFSTIIVCIIKNEGLKFVFWGNVLGIHFFLRIGLKRILSIKIVQYSKYGVKIRILMFFQVCFWCVLLLFLIQKELASYLFCKKSCHRIKELTFYGPHVIAIRKSFSSSSSLEIHLELVGNVLYCIYKVLM